MQDYTYKQNLHLSFNKLIKLLSERDIKLIVDEEISLKSIVMFNGYITDEGFEDGILNGDLVSFYKSISDFEFNELDKDKLRALKNYMIGKLNSLSLDPFENMVFEDKVNQLSPDQKDAVYSFIKKQEEIKEVLLLKLSEGGSDLDIRKFRKVKWQGTQQQFCELLVELESKSWIEPLEEWLKAGIIRSICHVFDFSNTQKTPNAAKAEESITRTMHSKLTNRFNEMVLVYDKIHTPQYIPKFFGIEKRD